MITDKDENTTTKEEQPQFVKRAGNTTYEVHVHFSKTSTETITDKIMRLIRNDVNSA